MPAQSETVKRRSPARLEDVGDEMPVAVQLDAVPAAEEIMTEPTPPLRGAVAGQMDGAQLGLGELGVALIDSAGRPAVAHVVLAQARIPG